MQNENSNQIKSLLLLILFSTGASVISYAMTTQSFARITINTVQVYAFTGEIRTYWEGDLIKEWEEQVKQRNKWEEWHNSPNRSDAGRAERKSPWAMEPTTIKLHNDKATEIAKFMERRKDEVNKLWQKRDVMMASYMQESGLNPRAKWQLSEMWMCQLMQNKTNNKRLKNPLWNDWKRQADRCIDKWIAVSRENKWMIWASYGSNEYKKYLHYFK